MIWHWLFIQIGLFRSQTFHGHVQATTYRMAYALLSSVSFPLFLKRNIDVKNSQEFLVGSLWLQYFHLKSFVCLSLYTLQYKQHFIWKNLLRYFNSAHLCKKKCIFKKLYQLGCNSKYIICKTTYFSLAESIGRWAGWRFAQLDFARI